jgi:hypothetical protein
MPSQERILICDKLQREFFRTEKSYSLLSFFMKKGVQKSNSRDISMSDYFESFFLITVLEIFTV